MMRQSLDSRRGFVWWFAVLGMAGCAAVGGGLTKDTPPEAKQAAVKERVNAFWAAQIKGDMDSAYGFLSPTSRQTVSLATYVSRKGKIQYTSAAIESVNCDAEACKVELKVTYDYPVPGKIMRGIQTPLSETWVLDKGAAWLVYL
jgi:hypothetical protein